MSELAPIAQFLWKGGAMIPATAYQLELCRRYYEDDKRYALTEHRDRSDKSHNHYFASLATAWQNLPEGMADDFPTPEHLRKRALIHTGYYDERRLICESPAKAREFAAFCRPLDDYALISVCGPVVVVRTAKSQAKKAMGRKVFNESKQAVLAWCADLIGIDLAVLTSNTGKAA